MQVIEVGQIVYILDSKSRAIVPAYVFEQVTSRTVEGEKTHHVLQLPDSKKVILEKLGSPWFVDTSSAKKFLLEEAEEMIGKIVLKAEKIARERFPNSTHQLAQVSELTTADDHQAPPPPFADDSKVKMDLGDGTIANVTIPKEFLDENFSN